MKSLTRFANQSASITLLADDILEFHASRLLLLFRLCGTSGIINGLTKMAKLDFFVRYPQFFHIACIKLGVNSTEAVRHIESSMIRFHYGPWDERYYHLLSYLKARQLIKITTKDNMYELGLTNTGNDVTSRLVNDSSFSDIVKHMGEVKKVLGAKTGSALKRLVYQLFEDEVANRSFGEVID